MRRYIGMLGFAKSSQSRYTSLLVSLQPDDRSELMATAALGVERLIYGSEERRPKARFYSPELDALRFIAFLLVFGRHVVNLLGFAKIRADASTGAQSAVSRPPIASAAHGMSHAWVNLQGALQSLDFGVCLFFFLSSFLITRLLLMEKSAEGDISVRDFYIRRTLRIWPLYFFFIAFMVTLSRFIPAINIQASRVWASVFFVSNWAAVLHGWSGQAIQPLWSVSVEEQFYAVWPNVARAGRAAIILLSILFIGISLGTLVHLGHQTGTQVTQIWPNTLVQGLFLSGGALTACLSFPETRRLLLPVRLALTIGGFSLWVVATVAFHVVRTNSPGALDLVAGYLLVLLGTFMIFTGVAGWDCAVPAWLRYLGKISYGLYVYHAVCLIVMEPVTTSLLGRFAHVGISPYTAIGISSLLAFLLTLVCAMLSYKFLELPFLRLKERFSIVQSRAA
jgi:peptidoglycan/LPS O-acetylase OafA/YrhL